MARINIEDDIFKDSRFFSLSIKTGSMQNALGCLAWAYSIAQKHYLKTENDRLIPEQDWIIQGCSDLLIEVGLAEKREKGIYVCGAKEQFGWLIQRSEAGKSKSKKHSTTANDRSVSLDSVSTSKPPTPTLLYSTLKEEADAAVLDFKIPTELFNTLKMTQGYPDTIIEKVRKDAELCFIGSIDPKKNWKRFCANYFKNESQKIREYLSQEVREKTINEELQEIFNKGNYDV